jgi:hypothetical protein
MWELNRGDHIPRMIAIDIYSHQVWRYKIPLLGRQQSTSVHIFSHARTDL